MSLIWAVQMGTVRGRNEYLAMLPAWIIYSG